MIAVIVFEPDLDFLNFNSASSSDSVSPGFDRIRYVCNPAHDAELSCNPERATSFSEAPKVPDYLPMLGSSRLC